jgi:Uma2 family endonuclease
MAVRQPHRFTVAQYEAMGRAGIFGEDHRLELIDGQIIEMTPIGPPHAGTVNALIALFSRAVGDKAIISAQNPAILSDVTEPQPDILLLRPRPDAYRGSHPRPDDIYLAIEVADSSGDFDRHVKGPLYARAGVSEYWIIDLQRRAIEVHRSPGEAGYGEVENLKDGDRISPAAFPYVDVAVADILGPPPSH